MGMREIRLPADLVPLGEMIVEAFQYPENEQWSVQTDEREQIVSMLNNLRRVWPFIRLIQGLSPPLRDLLRGHIWEEEGQTVGTTIFQRRGSTDLWHIGTVGVLPDYRRRGIARQLVEKALATIRERGGIKTVLSVIDGNVPAYALYERLGFEHFAGSVEFTLTPDRVFPEPQLPQTYSRSPLGFFDWKPRYELETRILPEAVSHYEPAKVGRFRRPAAMRLLWPLISLAQGARDEEFVIRTVGEGRVVARGGSSIPTRGKGVNQLWIRLDPAHDELAPYLVGYLLHKVTASSLDHRVELSVDGWMDAVISAAAAAGFQRRMEYCRMGIDL
jgi:GNAT superfamily N-acetyltransferase